MDYRRRYQIWMESGALNEEQKAELAAIGSDEKELESRFFAPLEFGTAGLRGILGMGDRRMNVYVVRQATQAMADMIVGKGREAMERGCAICYDCRNGSREFAKEAACVMAGSGVHVRIFAEMRPTPELSFAIRHYRCMAGINITASHNPKEYNGYKVYWEDGAQLPPEEAAEVAGRMEKIDLFSGPVRADFEKAKAEGLITLMGAETDEAFLEKALACRINPEAPAAVADRFTVVYTPFHGTGRILVPEALSRAGFERVLCVPEQMVADGAFPTVKSPNPEETKSFEMAVALAEKNSADLIIGTDPDADRIGVLARDEGGAYSQLTGNQVGVLLLHYMLSSLKASGRMPENPAAIKTIVTTEMARAVCEKMGVACYDTFTGFKFMAELIGRFEERENGPHYLFAYEESYGYMTGDHVRDKDAVTASVLVAEMAAWYHARNMSLHDALKALWRELGFYAEYTVNLVMPGVDGLRDMANIMARLRETPPAEMAGMPVLAVRDYLPGIRRVMRGGKAEGPGEKMELRGSNVLSFELEDGTRLVVRPSGTEPKIKVYALARGEDRKRAEQWAERLAKNALPTA